MDTGKRLKQLASILITAGGFYIVLRNLDLSKAWTALVSADPLYFAAGSIVLVFIYFLMGERWRVILGDKEVEVSQMKAFEQLLVSDFVNSFLPARAGDIYRGYMASGEEKSTLDTSVMVLMERVMDVTAITLLLSLALVSFYPGKKFIMYPAAAGALLLIGLAGLYLLWKLEEPPIPLLEKYYSTLRGVIVENFTTTRLVELFLLTVVIWMMGVARTFTVFEALGIPAGIGLITVVTFLWAVIAVLPLTPAGLGATDAAVFLLLASTGFGSAEAAAFIALNRLMLQGVPVILGGSLYIRRSG